MIDPKMVVDNWDIRPEMKVADFGCGAGHYSLEVAKRLGGDGRVYAFDVQPEVLSALKSRANLDHLPNLEIRRADLELEKGTGLLDGIVDLVIVSNVLFQVENKESVVKEASRILKTGGQMTFIDWETGAFIGPPKTARVDKGQTEELCAKNKLFLVKKFDAGDHHYGLIFKKA